MSCNNDHNDDDDDDCHYNDDDDDNNGDLPRRTYTMTSMSDGSSSTIMVEEWQPIFDRFDLESDGKMVSTIFMMLTMLILLMTIY